MSASEYTSKIHSTALVNGEVFSNKNKRPIQGSILSFLKRMTGPRGYVAQPTTTLPAITTTTLPAITTTTLSPTTTTTLSPTTTTTLSPTTTSTTIPMISNSVSTFVGSTEVFGPGYLDGIGTNARFNFPRSIVLDSANNIYVCDIGNNRIRKVTPSGVVTTFAGSGVFSYLDATGTNAQFHSPYGITIDSAGNLYVCDNGNNKIRKITPEGVVTTFGSMSFNNLHELTIDSSNNLYVSESGANLIRKITPEGVVTTLAGSTQGFQNGTGTDAQFNFPRSLVLDSLNNLYVCDSRNNRIRKITPEGVVTTLAGEGSAGYANGTGTSAQFNNPTGIAISSSGDLYVGDHGNHRIRKITPTGVVTTVAGTDAEGYLDGDLSVAQFGSPINVAFDSLGYLYVTDFYNHSIRKISL